MARGLFRHLSGVKRDLSWRLKLVAWLEIIFGAIVFLFALQVIAMSNILPDDLRGKARALFPIILIAGLLRAAASAYAGLMLLDRSRQAGVLTLINVFAGLGSALAQRPVSYWILGLQMLSVIFVISIWNELEGPLPFNIKSERQVFLGIAAIFAVSLAREPSKSRKSRRPPIGNPSNNTVVRAAADTAGIPENTIKAGPVRDIRLH